MDKYNVGHFSYRTDIGMVRRKNEDQAVAMMNANGDVLLLVADGMGGSNKGDYASYLAKSYFVEAFTNKKKFRNKTLTISWLRKVVRETNKKIFDESTINKECEGMGTTLTVAMIIKDSLIVGEIGDSRCYQLENDEFIQLTEDQTQAMRLYRNGKITKEQLETHPDRHVLINALGCYPSTNMIIESFNYHDQTVMLCTDGLYNNVPVSNISNIVKGTDSIDQKVNQLIALANINGGSDNIGVVLWEASK